MFLIPMAWLLCSSAFIAILSTQLVCHCCINRKGLYPALDFGRKSNSPLGSELKLASTLGGNISTFLCLMQYHCLVFPPLAAALCRLVLTMFYTHCMDFNSSKNCEKFLYLHKLFWTQDSW